MFHDSGLARLDLEGFATLVSLRTLAESLFGILPHHGLAIPLCMNYENCTGCHRNVFKNVQCKYTGVVQNYDSPKLPLRRALATFRLQQKHTSISALIPRDR